MWFIVLTFQSPILVVPYAVRNQVRGRAGVIIREFEVSDAIIDVSVAVDFPQRWPCWVRVWVTNPQPNLLLFPGLGLAAMHTFVYGIGREKME